MQSAQVFVLSAVLAVGLVVAQAAPVPGLLTGLFGGDDSQPKPNNVDINQLLRQYYLNPTEDPYSQYNPFAPPVNFGPSNFGQPNYGPSINYGQPNYAPYIDPGFGGPQSSPFLGNPYQGSLQLYRGGPSVRSAGSDDSVAANHYSGQLDSLLPNSGQALQHFANFRSLNLPSAEGLQSQQTAEVLPSSQSALRAPAARALSEANSEAASVARSSNAEGSLSSKQ